MWGLNVRADSAMRKRNAGLSRAVLCLLEFAQVSRVSAVSPGHLQLCLQGAFSCVSRALSARQPQLLAGHDTPIAEVVEGLQLHHQGAAISVWRDPRRDLP